MKRERENKDFFEKIRFFLFTFSLFFSLFSFLFLSPCFAAPVFSLSCKINKTRSKKQSKKNTPKGEVKKKKEEIEKEKEEKNKSLAAKKRLRPPLSPSSLLPQLRNPLVPLLSLSLSLYLSPIKTKHRQINPRTSLFV